MAFDAIRKELQRVVCTCYLACPAVALCEGGKTLPLSDRSEGALTILRSFEIASSQKISKAAAVFNIAAASFFAEDHFTRIFASATIPLLT